MCSCNDTMGEQATVNQNCLLPMDPLGDTPLTRTSWWVLAVHRADKVRDLKGDAHLCPERQQTLIIQPGESAKKKKRSHAVVTWKANFSINSTHRLLSGNHLNRWNFQKNLSKTVSKGRMANLILSLALMNYSLCSSPHAWGTLLNTLWDCITDGSLPPVLGSPLDTYFAAMP